MATEEQLISTGAVAVEALKLIVVGGIGGAVATCIGNWFVNQKLQAQKLEHDKQLASLKSQLEKKNTVHKLQFEKEFQLYGELWKVLVDMQRSARITPVFDRIPVEESPLDVYKKRWMKAAEMLQKAIDVLYYNIPFYHRNISELADELLTRCKGEIGSIKSKLELENIDTETSLKNDQMFATIICSKKNIEMAIRDRIDLLQKAEIVG